MSEFYDHESVDSRIKAVGNSLLVLGIQGSEGVEILPVSITMNELICYIHKTGGCAGSHLNEMEKQALAGEPRS